MQIFAFCWSSSKSWDALFNSPLCCWSMLQRCGNLDVVSVDPHTGCTCCPPLMRTSCGLPSSTPLLCPLCEKACSVLNLTALFLAARLRSQNSLSWFICDRMFDLTLNMRFKLVHEYFHRLSYPWSESHNLWGLVWHRCRSVIWYMGFIKNSCLEQLYLWDDVFIYFFCIKAEWLLLLFETFFGGA